MFNLTLRQAETAFKDGRLSEACELVQQEAVRKHFAGQKLTTKLTAALVERSGQHLDAGRLEEAARDCGLARQLAAGQEAVEALYQRITKAMGAERRRMERHRQLIAAVKAQVRQGRLSAGERMLDDASQASQASRAGESAVMLRRDVADRQAAAASALERARAAMDAKAWDAAIDGAIEARRAHAESGDVRTLVNELTERVIETIRAALGKGRLDAAAALAKRLRLMAGDDWRLAELEAAMSDCCGASRAISQGDFSQAGRLLARAKQVLPEAVWIEGAMERAQRAMREVEAMQAGPLGMLASTRVPQPGLNGSNGSVMGSATNGHDRLRSPESIKDRAKDRGAARMDAKALGNKFVLNVDGVGAFLVLCGDEISLGPASPVRSSGGGVKGKPMVGFMAPADTPGAMIERHDEEYVIRADGPIKVNDETVTSTSRPLLGGERIELSPRCRFMFAMSNAASTTAVLKLSGAKLMRRDIRQVILMDRSLVIGSGSDVHVRVPDLPERTVLFMHNGELHCRSESRIEVDGQVADASTPIGLGARVRVGEASMTFRSLD